ncbi:NAD(P)/FAD-dependent oxidoreductase [Novosphingobium malaysiense]|uniref:FAD-dependent oxidoreductase n=1 Tax=Novosphingobium malaysiense TaxID=1348853 RepID=A0A0B1ZIP1_9SPHN|nr:NAD(P)/FAD-dependent oxidoreductase [Novosphingobium malaysiense]KHK89118.1 FAD-dependent oxidoreductase [Novosphingobium malaysiense]
MTERVEAIVVGAGVVGLAVARALALAGKPALILEGESLFGSWTSSRNSEVIHAGIYYPEGSLKAALCVEGKEMLYAFCEARGVPYKRLGKLVFAHDESQFGELDRIVERASGAGVTDLQFLDRTAVRALEPELDCAGALISPSTGIVDSHALMLALLGEAEAHDAMLAVGSPVSRITRADGLWQVWMDGMDEPVVSAPVLVNSAGLAAQALAQATEGLDPAHVPPIYYARGVYFTYSGKVPFSRLIYPVPEAGGLGTHLTLDLAGQARFGPDVEWIDTVDYTVDPGRHAKFAVAAKRIWPQLDPDRLQPGYAGVRPKVSGPGEPAADFIISGPADHGCEGLVNLFGIESPGLTASLAIAERVVGKLA